MGARKHKRAEALKEARKNVAIAHLNDTPTSPYKMRLVADMIRGQKVELALHSLRSAIANWEAKNEGKRVEDSNLYVKEIWVDEGRTLKRIQAAPHGRAFHIRKRSNHVTIIVDSRIANDANEE